MLLVKKNLRSINTPCEQLKRQIKQENIYEQKCDEIVSKNIYLLFLPN